MRKTFVNTLLAEAKLNPDIWLLTGDLGFTVLEGFRDVLPNQYLNAGVAEQNMTSVAAGLALSGKTVFTYSIVPFATFRCFEQIRNDICYHELPVCVVGVGAGYSYGHMGSTHHSLEDIAAIRSLPNMTVICPGDPLEVEAAVKAIIKLKKPCYLRLGKAGEPEIHDKKKFSFEIGKAIEIIKGDDVTLIATSNMLETAFLASKLLKERNLRPRLLSMHTVKPIDREALRLAADETRLIVTIEEQCFSGGLGSAVAEAIADLPVKPPQMIFSAPDRFAETTGSQAFFRKRAGLTAENISERILESFRSRDAASRCRR